VRLLARQGSLRAASDCECNLNTEPEPLIVKQGRAGVTFGVKVTPRASRDEVVGVEAGELKVRLAAPPVEGAANAALVDLLARRLGLAKSHVTLLGGQTSRHKIVAVVGRGAAEITALLSKG
jgi:uncharacterized protein (TIGR00251 family)